MGELTGEMTEEAEEMVACTPVSEDILSKIEDAVNEYFDHEGVMYSVSPSICCDSATLMVYVKTNSSVYESLERLHRFDEEFFLDLDADTRELVCVDTYFIE